MRKYKNNQAFKILPDPMPESNDGESCNKNCEMVHPSNVCKGLLIEPGKSIQTCSLPN